MVISRKEYEGILRYLPPKAGEIKLTLHQKKRLQKARKNFSEGKTITLYELEKRLGARNCSRRL